MILEYSCENYRSIKERVSFSLLAGKDHSLEENLYTYKKDSINRIAGLYGSNGSGKTSFFESILTLKSLVKNSNNHQPGDMLRQTPHKLAAPQTPTAFDVKFVKNSIKYEYILSYVTDGVISEELYYFPNGKKSKIFTRKQNDIKFGDDFKKEFDPLQPFVKPNKLFLSVSANYSSVKEVIDTFLFFKEDLIFYPQPVEKSNWLEYSIERFTNEPAFKKLFIKFMNAVDCPIKDIQTRFEQFPMSQELIPDGVPEEIKPFFAKAKVLTRTEANIDYGLFSINLNEESKGTKKLFEVFGPIVDIVMKGRVLLWDEIETSLHPIIVREILHLISDGGADSRAQLIFSTHDTGLLDLKRFRRDQIWLTQLNESRATELYSLSEINNVRKDENVGKNYLLGKYGAIPIKQVEFALRERS